VLTKTYGVYIQYQGFFGCFQEIIRIYQEFVVTPYPTARKRNRGKLLFISQYIHTLPELTPPLLALSFTSLLQAY
jgi:hypothetical protein